MPPVYSKKGGKLIKYSADLIVNYFPAQPSTEQNDGQASSLSLPIPKDSNRPQLKKRRLSDVQNSPTPSRGGLGDTQVVDGSGANPLPVNTNTRNVSLSIDTSASNSHADVNNNIDVIDGDTTRRCGTLEHAGTTPNGDASNSEDVLFDSVYHYSPKDKDLNSNTQALGQDPQVLGSVVFNDADDDKDASVPQDSKARVEKAMRLTIEILKKAAEDIDFSDLSTKKPLTPSLAWLLHKNDVNHFLSHYLRGFPAKVLALFEEDT
jgi:hypothetical protein